MKLVVMVVLVVEPEKKIQQVEQEIHLPLVHLKEIMVEQHNPVVEEQEAEVEQLKQE